MNEITLLGDNEKDLKTVIFNIKIKFWIVHID